MTQPMARSSVDMTRSSVDMADLQYLVKKHQVTKSESKTAVAKRLLNLRSHVMPKHELDMLEDYLQLPKKKRFVSDKYNLL